jgi:DNA-directed RNA polymerase subunit RPC12/RpoP
MASFPVSTIGHSPASVVHHMRLFRHLTAEYTCTKCGHGRSVVESAFSPFDAIAVIVAAVPVVAVALHKPWNFPWYCVFPILAGEILAVFAAGLLTSIGLGFSVRGGNLCRDCGGRMFFAGRHFDPSGDRSPHYVDIILFTGFLALNAMFWLAYCTGQLSR